MTPNPSPQKKRTFPHEDRFCPGMAPPCPGTRRRCEPADRRHLARRAAQGLPDIDRNPRSGVAAEEAGQPRCRHARLYGARLGWRPTSSWIDAMTGEIAKITDPPNPEGATISAVMAAASAAFNPRGD